MNLSYDCGITSVDTSPAKTLMLTDSRLLRLSILPLLLLYVSSKVE